MNHWAAATLGVAVGGPGSPVLEEGLCALSRWLLRLLELAGAPAVTVTRAEAGEGRKLLSSRVARSLMLTSLLGEGES